MKGIFVLSNSIKKVAQDKYYFASIVSQKNAAEFFPAAYISLIRPLISNKKPQRLLIIQYLSKLCLSMPSFFILDVKVVGGRLSTSAAPPSPHILPLHCFNTLII